MISFTAQIPLLSSDRQLAQTVSAASAGQASQPTVELCRNLTELAALLERHSALAAIVDVDGQTPRFVPSLETLIAHFPETRFLLVSSDVTNALLIEAMQIGVRHVLAKGSLENDLPDVLQRLAIAGGVRSAGDGRIVTVLSAGGGCGGTTLAVNLANEIRLQEQKPVLLVDMDSYNGSAAAYLGVKGSYGLSDVLSRIAGADAELIRSTASKFAENGFVLLSPASVSFASPAALSYHNLDVALESCKLAFPYTVIDAPRMPMALAATLANASSMVLISMQLTVKDVCVARNIRQALLEQGISAEAILPVVSRYSKRATLLDLDEARKALGNTRILPLHNDFRGVLRSLDFGQPLAQSAPKSSLRKDICILARELASRSGQPSVSAQARG